MHPILVTCLALCLPAPAHAWQAGQDGAICTLDHSEASGDIRLTYDPAGPLYTITVTRAEPWPVADLFGIAFLGGEENTITTERHSLSDDGRAISVADRGFGNVLRGLAANTAATVFAGTETLSVSLAGAAPEVAAFEACGTRPSA